jgi:hypothetical protein
MISKAAPGGRADVRPRRAAAPVRIRTFQGCGSFGPRLHRYTGIVWARWGEEDRGKMNEPENRVGNHERNEFVEISESWMNAFGRFDAVPIRFQHALIFADFR